MSSRLDLINNFSLSRYFNLTFFNQKSMLSVVQIQHLSSNPFLKTPALKFKSNTPKKIKQILGQMAQPVPKYLNEKILSSEYLPEILSYIDSWYTLQSLYSTKIQNAQFQLLKSVQMISFPRLNQLYLENMNLCNIEGIQYIDAPNLKAIYLMGNKIVSIKAIAKSRFNLIQILQLNRELNHSELFNLTRTKISDQAKITTSSSFSVNNKDKKRQKSSHLRQVIFKLEFETKKIQLTLSQKLNKRFEALVMEINGGRK